MIIPIKCFTCGTVIADNARKLEKVIYLTPEYSEKTPKGFIGDI